MTAVTSRRSILAGAAALPALSIPAIGTEHHDAELIALGHKFDVLEAAYHDAVKRNAPYEEAFQQAIKRLGDRRPPEGYTNERFITEVDKEMEGAPSKSDPRPDDILGLMDKPMRRIMTLPAKTMEGLKVKARCARFACDFYWDKPFEDAEWDHMAARSTIDAILALK